MNWKDVVKAILGFIQAHFLPLANLVAVLVAMLAPAPGIAVGSIKAGPFHLIAMLNIIIVFFITGLTLNTKNFRAALKFWPGILWGFITILAVTPCLGFALNAIPFTPTEFSAGLAIFSAAPTTIGVGAALVRQSKGNNALALLLLIGTNILAVITLPLWLKALIGSSPEYNLDFDLGQMIWQLMVTVFAPALVGKVLCVLIPAVARFATKYKELLGMFSLANLACIVWLMLSAAQHLLLEQQFVNILYIIIAAVLQHAIYLVLNAGMVRWVLRMPIEEGVAVTIMGSEKSASVSVTSILYLTSSVPTQGLLSVPSIVGQLVQIAMGSVIAPRIAKKVVKTQAKRKLVAEDAETVAVADGLAAAEETIENGQSKDDSNSGTVELPPKLEK